MKTTTKAFTRWGSALILCLLVAGLDSCNKVQEPITPKGKGAKDGIGTLGYPPPGYYYEGGYLTDKPITVKVVGQSSSINEDTDFRLYPTAIACQAYEYLFSHAFAAGVNELGAYITSRGVVLGPNNMGAPNHYSFKTWGTEPYDRTPILYTTTGNLTISGMMHTHPGGTTTPSPDDVTFLAKAFDVSQYIVTGFNVYQFNANGSSTQTASYSDKVCH